jgi:hypothetical protein
MDNESLFRERSTVTVKDGRPVLSNDQEGVALSVSPTSTPVIPPAAVPYFLAGAGVLQVIGEEFANPAPWTLARAFGLGAKVISFLTLGALPGLHRKDRK